MLFGRYLIGVCDCVGALAAAPPRFEGRTAARSVGRTGWTTEALAGAPCAMTTGLKDVTAERPIGGRRCRRQRHASSSWSPARSREWGRPPSRRGVADQQVTVTRRARCSRGRQRDGTAALTAGGVATKERMTCYLDVVVMVLTVELCWVEG